MQGVAHLVGDLGGHPPDRGQILRDPEPLLKIEILRQVIEHQNSPAERRALVAKRHQMTAVDPLA